MFSNTRDFGGIHIVAQRTHNHRHVRAVRARCAARQRRSPAMISIPRFLPLRWPPGPAAAGSRPGTADRMPPAQRSRSASKHLAGLERGWGIDLLTATKLLRQWAPIQRRCCCRRQRARSDPRPNPFCAIARSFPWPVPASARRGPFLWCRSPRGHAWGSDACCLPVLQAQTGCHDFIRQRRIGLRAR